MALGCPCRALSTGEDASWARASPLAAAVKTEAEAAVGAVDPVPPTAARAVVVLVVEEEGRVVGAVVLGTGVVEAAISSKLLCVCVFRCQSTRIDGVDACV